MILNIAFIMLAFHSVIVKGDCGVTEFYESSGEIKSADFQSDLSCTYRIRNRWNVVKLQWKFFNIDGKMPNCSTDYVLVTTG